MKTKISLFLAVLFAVIVIGCNSDSDNNDKNGGVNPIIGTWKLTQAFVNDAPVTLTSCEQMESYLFGPEQFTHELYQSGGRGYDDSLASRGDDDDDDDHHSEGDDDDDDDDHNNGGSTGGGSSGGGSGSNPSANCVVSSTVLGAWSNPSGADYVFTVNGQPDTKAIYFGTDLNTFYYVETTNIGGVTTVKKYVYQRQ